MNATFVAAVSYAGTNIANGTTANCNTIGIGTNTSSVGTGSTSMSYAGITLTNTSGSSWVVGFGGDTTVATCNPTGMTNFTSTGTGPQVTGNDTNGGVSTWTTKTCTVTSSSWRTAIVEVIANPCYGTSLGGGWTCVQGGSTAGSGSSVASVSVTPRKTLTNPSLLLVACQSNQANGATSNARESFGVPTDSLSHNFVDAQVGLTWFHGQAVSGELFYTFNTSTSADTIQCNTGTGGNADFFSAVYAEITGGVTSGSPIDPGAKYYNPEQTSVSSGANALSMTSQTTTVNNDLIFAFFNLNGGPGHPGTSPNAFTEISQTGGETEVFDQSTAGSIGPTAGDDTGPDDWGGIWVALVPSGTSAEPTNNYRNDQSITADGTSLGQNFILEHIQAITSDSLPVLSASMIITRNPTVGDYLMCQNQFFPVASLSISCADGLGNVAGGNVTQTNPHTITFHDGVPFNMLGASAESGGTNVWNGKTITVNGSALTINTVASPTSLTVTQTVSTNATPVPYVGPSWSCTDVGDGAAISMNACRAFVTSTGSDTLTVTATIASANFDLGGTYIELGYSGGKVVGEDPSACPVAACAQQDLTSNASTGIVSESLTLTNSGELTLISGDGVVGPDSITSGSISGILGVTGSGSATTLTNPYCQLSLAFCINEIQSAFLAFSTSGSHTVNGLTDATKGEQHSTQAFAFIGQTTPSSTFVPQIGGFLVGP